MATTYDVLTFSIPELEGALGLSSFPSPPPLQSGAANFLTIPKRISGAACPNPTNPWKLPNPTANPPMECSCDQVVNITGNSEKYHPRTLLLRSSQIRPVLSGTANI